MYTQANQAKIDPALQALLAVAKQVTPTGQPTVAAQMAEAAQQPPQPPQPQGIEAALEQSATAAPSVAQLMQQQQMPPEMPPEMQKQMEPPMEPQGGIASLPVPVGEYAEGSVVGYAEGGETPTLGQVISSGLGSIMPSRIPSNPKEEAWLRRNAAATAVAEAPPSLPSFQFSPGGDLSILIRQLTAELQAPDTSPAAKIALAKKIAELTAQLPPSERQLDRVRSDDVGILTPRPEPTMPSIERPTAASAMEMARLLVPNVDRSESRRLYEERKAQQAASPDFEAMKAKALEESAAQEQGGRGMEKLLQALGGLSQGGVRGMAGSLRQYEQTTKGLDAAYKQGQIALKEAAQAKAEGNLTKLMEANAKLEDAEAKQADAISRAGIQALSSQSSQYSTDVGAASDAARIASAERIARMGGTQGALLDLFQRDPALFASFNQATAGGKKAGMSPQEIREMLIERWLKMESMEKADLARTEGINTVEQFLKAYEPRMSGQNIIAPSAPVAGEVMQGYRFKGGNPADKSNWEKV